MDSKYIGRVVGQRQMRFMAAIASCISYYIPNSQCLVLSFTLSVFGNETFWA